MSINKPQLGHAIRQVREMRGFSQALLAEKSGLQGNTVALIERGARGVSLDALNKLAHALAIPAGCLTMLGTSKIKGDSANAELVTSMQDVILSTIFAQTQLEAKEKAAKLNQAKVAAISASPRLNALVQKASGSKKGQTPNRTAKRKNTVKTRKRTSLKPA
jgi:transcriptional regulator with XRE-family HTH domain